MEYVLEIIKSLWSAISPFTGIFIVIVLTIFVIQIVKTIFRKKQAEPYYTQLTTLLVVLFGLFLVVLFLPISNEMKKQILTLIGVLLSAVIALSSTSLIGNAMAGIMLRVSKSYRPGDFIEVESTRGRVFNQGLFSTEVQIITRDTVSFPNMYLIQHPIRVTRSDGSFISAGVSLGYDVPRMKIEESLLKAAEKTGLEDPFVYVEKLMDHAVEYRVFGLLKETTKMLTLRSDLRKTVLDVLHQDGIEIVSPSFMNRREYDEQKSFIPPVTQQEPEESSSESKVEEIAFDKAEEADSIEKLKEDYSALIKKKEELSEKIKEESDKESKKEMEDEIKRIEKRSEELTKYIEKRQKEKNKNI
ncbi:MAG: mechanosensitive ion channel [Spirochaetes bacterium]|nr:mechanosensitive ion channel [Spirochaetota bacterium]